MNQERMYKILLRAHISEKATVLADEANQFAFQVARNATKAEIKEAVETIYKVPVKDVTVLNVKGKIKAGIRGISRKPNWKKAYVRLEDGHDIDFTATSD